MTRLLARAGREVGLSPLRSACFFLCGFAFLSLSLSASIVTSFLCLYLCLSAFFLSLSVYLSVYINVVCLSLSFCLSTCLFIYISIHFLSIYPSVYIIYTHLSVYLLIYPSMPIHFLPLVLKSFHPSLPPSLALRGLEEEGRAGWSGQGGRSLKSSCRLCQAG